MPLPEHEMNQIDAALQSAPNDQGRRAMQLSAISWQLGRHEEAAREAAASIAAGMNPLAVFTSLLRRIPSITGTTRAISSSIDTGSAPGRVDSPPMSMIAAPSSAMRSAASIAI